MSLSVEELLNILSHKNYRVFRQVEQKSLNLNIIGVRKNLEFFDTFSDELHVFFEDGDVWEHYCWPITTLPGKVYLLNPLTRNGTAILAPGQYIGAYRIGLHKNQYPALVQVGKVTVYRDGNKDAKPDKDSKFQETGIFGINIHKAGALAKIVGANSAGCQVFKSASDFAEFMQLCENSRSVWGNMFSYTLVEI
jgi:hypothetical protein